MNSKESCANLSIFPLVWEDITCFIKIYFLTFSMEFLRLTSYTAKSWCLLQGHYRPSWKPTVRYASQLNKQVFIWKPIPWQHIPALNRSPSRFPLHFSLLYILPSLDSQPVESFCFPGYLFSANVLPPIPMAITDSTSENKNNANKVMKICITITIYQE